MPRLPCLVIAAALAACEPAAESQRRRIDLDIAQIRQEIASIEADAMRRRAEWAAVAHEFADQPTVLAQLEAAARVADRAMTAADAAAIAGFRRLVVELEQRRADLSAAR